VSLAGKQKGDRDERWLWKDMHRVCKALRPRWMLAENVRGLLSAGEGRLFGTILADLASIGYDAEWHCISASAFGAPHVRERLFILAYPTGSGLHGNEQVLGRAPGQGPGIGSRWISEPKVDRVGNGTPNRVDRNRIRSIGNAVVPKVARWIGTRILEYESWRKEQSSAPT
jgi:DNA (cytosine-5)-methyltransferase 1